MEQQNTTPSPEQEIDLIELARKVWKERKFILKACGIGAVVGLIVAFSIPKEYKTTVKLSPENSETNKTGQLSGLAAMAGINLGGTTSSDALTPELYPDIVQSTPFLLELVNIPVETQNGKLKTTFYDYIDNHQKAVWWSYITGAPFKVLGWVMSVFKEKDEDEKSGEINPFKLTQNQEDYVKTVQQYITIVVDKNSGIISASVFLQDPLISATIMNVVITKLQEYITDYRTRKAKHDLVFTEKLHKETQISYYTAQKNYASFIDSNRNIISATFRTEEERLRNEMTLAYGVYSQMAQQLESNKVKVQEVTPVYTVIEPAKVSLRAEKPKKPMILIAFVLLAGFVSVCWILVRDFIISFKNNKSQQL